MSHVLLIVLAICAWFYLDPLGPTFIANVRASEDDSFGSGSYVLVKSGSGQVAVFHGFVRDNEVCEIAKRAIEAEGGTYTCLPASMVAPAP